MRLTAALVALLLLCCGVTRAEDSNEELLKAVLETFLGAGDLKSAAEVAQKGARRYPGSLYWQEKTGDVLSWLSRPEEALKYYKEALKTDKDVQFVKKVKTVAVGLKDYETAAYATELQLQSGDAGAVNDLVYIYEQLGYPEKAIQALKKYGSGEAAGIKTAEIMSYLGRIQDAGLQYKKLIKEFGGKTVLVTAYAKILIAQRRPAEAYSELKSAERHASTQDHDFWHALGAAAFSADEHDTALRAAKVLRDDRAADLQEYDWLINSAGKDDRKLAAAYSLEAWDKFRKPYLLIQYLGFASAAGDYLAADEALKGLTKSDMETVGVTPGFWPLKAAVSRELGDTAGALSAYREGIRRNPGDESLKAQLAWFLMDAGLLDELRRELPSLTRPSPMTDNLRTALAYSYYSLNDSRNSLKYLRSLAAQDRGSRLLKADLEDLDGHPEEAASARHAEWTALRAAAPADSEDAKAAARLCAVFCTAPGFREALHTDSGTLTNDERAELEVSRASLEGEPDRAASAAAGMEHRKPWLEFYLASLSGDRAGQDEILRKDLARLPLVDRINALDAGGYGRTASQETFEHLDRNPGNTGLSLAAASLFPQFTRGAGSKSEISKRKILEEISQEVSYSMPLTGAARLGFTGSYARLNSPAGSSLELEKNEYKKAGISLDTGKDLGIKAEAGARYEQKDFVYASLEYEGNIFRRTTLGIRAARADTAEESVYLLAGAFKDTLSISLAHTYTGDLTLKAEASEEQFLSQDRNYLGRQGLAGLEVSKSCELHTWRLVPNAKVTVADTSAALDGNYGVINDIARVYEPVTIPASYTQYGAGITLQKSWNGAFVRRPGPYLSAGYYYNTVYKSGGSVSAGISISLIKRDLLEIYVEYDKGLSGSSDEYKKAGASWKISF